MKRVLRQTTQNLWLQRNCCNDLPYEEGIKTRSQPLNQRYSESCNDLPYEEGITTRRGDRSVALVLPPPQQDSILRVLP